MPSNLGSSNLPNTANIQLRFDQDELDRQKKNYLLLACPALTVSLVECPAIGQDTVPTTPTTTSTNKDSEPGLTISAADPQLEDFLPSPSHNVHSDRSCHQSPKQRSSSPKRPGTPSNPETRRTDEKFQDIIQKYLCSFNAVPVTPNNASNTKRKKAPQYSSSVLWHKRTKARSTPVSPWIPQMKRKPSKIFQDFYDNPLMPKAKRRLSFKENEDPHGKNLANEGNFQKSEDPVTVLIKQREQMNKPLMELVRGPPGDYKPPGGTQVYDDV